MYLVGHIGNMNKFSHEPLPIGFEGLYVHKAAERRFLDWENGGWIE